MAQAPQSEYPGLLMEASTIFSNQCSGHAQIHQEQGEEMKISLQAPDIMKQFMGDVQIGKDPAGLLFYNNAQLDFSIPDQQFKYMTHGTGPTVTIQIDFYHPDSDGEHLLSRFLARVDSQNYPVRVGEGKGTGNWVDFRAGTAQALPIRAEGRTRLYLQFPALKKYVFFETIDESPISNTGGVFIFKDYSAMQDKIGDEAILASWTDDRIEFFIEGHPDNIVGCFYPHAPIGIGKMEKASPTTWKPFDPEDN
ncbi:hypothetical protein CVT24_010813 [Panaeolus cyanescens]|uniref:Uncharacterized protein n=1 Tax=Panaeolus cyanescens TaxID=181874 RepID=A0A409VGY5_9AGAR|nr:hypothetical protein CVT24_010813 [Panaeolus cyanescens]